MPEIDPGMTDPTFPPNKLLDGMIEAMQKALVHMRTNVSTRRERQIATITTTAAMIYGTAEISVEKAVEVAEKMFQLVQQREYRGKSNAK